MWSRGYKEKEDYEIQPFNVRFRPSDWFPIDDRTFKPFLVYKSEHKTAFLDLSGDLEQRFGAC